MILTAVEFINTTSLCDVYADPLVAVWAVSSSSEGPFW
jgi:hypothetical protein